MSKLNQNIVDMVEIEVKKLPLDYQEAVLAHVKYLNAAVDKERRLNASKNSLNFIE